MLYRIQVINQLCEIRDRRYLNAHYSIIYIYVLLYYDIIIIFIIMLLLLLIFTSAVLSQQQALDRGNRLSSVSGAPSDVLSTKWKCDCNAGWRVWTATGVCSPGPLQQKCTSSNSASRFHHKRYRFEISVNTARDVPSDTVIYKLRGAVDVDLRRVRLISWMRRRVRACECMCLFPPGCGEMRASSAWRAGVGRCGVVVDRRRGPEGDSRNVSNV